MTAPLNITVTLRGPLFTKKIDATVKKAILTEGLERIGKELDIKTARLIRRPLTHKKGAGLGAKRNPVHRKTAGIVMDIISRIGKYPRMSGRRWTENNMVAIYRMAPRMLRKIANRIVSELG
jgi:hypothetical protein